MGGATHQLELVFITSIAAVTIGSLCHRCALVNPKDIPGVRSVIFNVLLPMLILENQWTKKMDVSGSLVIWAAASQMLTFVFASLVWACGLMGREKLHRGWLMLVCTGASMGYPLALFGSKHLKHGTFAGSLPVVLAFDLAGNTWTTQVVMRIFAHRYRPAVTEKQACEVRLAGHSSRVPLASDDDSADEPWWPFRAKSGIEKEHSASVNSTTSTPVQDELATWRQETRRLRRSNTWSGDTRVDAMIEGHYAAEAYVDPYECMVKSSGFLDRNLPVSDLLEWLRARREGNGESAGYTSRILSAFRKLMINPVLLSFLIGVILNVTNVPCVEIIQEILKSFGAAFSPLLFFLLGAMMDLSPMVSNPELRMSVLWLLLMRTLVTGATAAICYFGMIWSGVDDKSASIFVVCLLAPVSNFSFAFALEFDYDTNLAALSSTFSNVLSFVIIWVLLTFCLA